MRTAERTPGAISPCSAPRPGSTPCWRASSTTPAPPAPACRRAWSRPACARIGMLDAVEEDLDLVARHDCNDRRSVQVLASLDPASRTAFKTFSTEGLKKKRTFLATVLPSTWTVSSPRLPFTRSTSTPGSFRKASATRAACSRVPPQTGHWRMVTFFIADLLSI